jgi:hypothetical protein
VPPLPPLPPGARPRQPIAIGADRGTEAGAFYHTLDAATAFHVFPFAGGFAGGVRTATGDVNGDGTDDLIVGTGPGIATRVRVLSGANQTELFAVEPFEPSFTGGVYVAAGDVDGDGRAEVVICPDEGGGPRARVFRGGDFAQLADFFGIEDPDFRGGARPALGDLDGDGRADLLVAAGYGGGPRLAVFDGRRLGPGGGPKLVADFFLFEPALRNGAFVAAGDVTGDGLADVVAGGGPGGGPRVLALSGRDLLAGSLVPAANFFAGDVGNRGGVRVAVKHLDGDDRADVVAGAGTGAGSRVTAYAGSTLSVEGTPPELIAFDALPGFAGGVFVG